MFWKKFQVSGSDKTPVPEVTKPRFLFTRCPLLFTHWLSSSTILYQKGEVPSCYYYYYYYYYYSYYSVTLRVPPLDSETSSTGELWSNCLLLILENLEKSNFFGIFFLLFFLNDFFKDFLRFSNFRYGLDWRALVESRPPNNGKLRGQHFFSLFLAIFFFLEKKNKKK